MCYRGRLSISVRKADRAVNDSWGLPGSLINKAPVASVGDVIRHCAAPSATVLDGAVSPLMTAVRKYSSPAYASDPSTITLSTILNGFRRVINRNSAC